MTHLVDKTYWSEAVPGPAPQRAQASRPPALLGGTRLRHSAESGTTLIGGALQVVAPLSADATWRADQLDERTLDRTSPAKLLELLADISPEISSALWTFLRLCNPGYTATALRRAGGSPAPQTVQAALQATLGTFKAQHGDLSVVIGRMFIGAFLRGAFFAELVLDASGRVPLDLATPDPETARFERSDDPERGTIFRLFQWQGGTKVYLDGYETIRYVPIDPFPNSPYGRALATPALFPCLFLITLFHDLARVVKQQGYPRIDIVIDLDKIKNAMPDDAEDDPEAFTHWVNDTTAQVAAAYSALKPDDAYVHTSPITVNKPVGAVDSSSLGAIDGLIKALERMATRALKSMPLLMGTSEGTSEANANRQWEIHAAGIKAIQHLCEGLLEHLLGLAMQAQGYACVVEFRFAELRAAERMRDAQTDKLEMENAALAYDRGWISQDESAQRAVGKAKADVPEPRTKNGTSISPAADSMDVQADPGSDR